MATLKGLARLLHYRLTRLAPQKVNIIRPPGVVPGTHEVGLVIASHNRPAYLRQTFESLSESVLDDTIVVIVDDASSSRETLQLVRDLSLGPTPIVRILRTRRRGFAVHEALRDGWDLLVGEYKCPLVANLDSDTMVKPEWLQRLKDLFHRERRRRGPLIVTGFNASSHQVLSEGPDYYVKASIGGLNMLFDAALYIDGVRPRMRYQPVEKVGWDWHVVAMMRERGYPMLCTRPSVIQHIGVQGEFAAPGCYDVAKDF